MKISTILVLLMLVKTINASQSVSPSNAKKDEPSEHHRGPRTTKDSISNWWNYTHINCLAELAQAKKEKKKFSSGSRVEDKLADDAFITQAFRSAMKAGDIQSILTMIKELQEYAPGKINPLTCRTVREYLRTYRNTTAHTFSQDAHKTINTAITNLNSTIDNIREQYQREVKAIDEHINLIKSDDPDSDTDVSELALPATKLPPVTADKLIQYRSSKKKRSHSVSEQQSPAPVALPKAKSVSPAEQAAVAPEEPKDWDEAS